MAVPALVLLVIAQHVFSYRFFARLPPSASQSDRFLAAGAFHSGLFLVLAGVLMLSAGRYALGFGSVALGVYMVRGAVLQSRAMRDFSQSAEGGRET